MRVHFAPSAVGFSQQPNKSRYQHQIFNRLEVVKAPPVPQNIRRDVLPGDYDEKVEVHPPDHQEEEVHIAGADIQILTAIVGLQTQGREHWHRMQEKNDVACEGVRSLSVESDFEV